MILMIGVKILIKLEEIDFSYDNEKIFENFSLKFKKGKFYALLGKNGCGKSTLINNYRNARGIDGAVGLRQTFCLFDKDLTIGNDNHKVRGLHGA